jgi:hypothetical protein
VERDLDDLVVERPCLEIIQNSEVIDQIQVINGLKKGTSRGPSGVSTSGRSSANQSLDPKGGGFDRAGMSGRCFRGIFQEPP